MPNGLSDGAIVIDTGLDNKGFIRDAAQFKRAVATLTQAVKTSGQQMAGGMDGYLKALGKAGSAAKTATGEQAALQKEIDKTAAAIERMEARQTKMKALAEQRAQAQRDELRAQMIEETKAAIGHGNWEIMPKWSQDQAIEQTMRDFEGRLAAIQAQPVENTDGWRSLQYDIDMAREKLAGLQAQLVQMQSEALTKTAAEPVTQVAEAIAQPVQAAEEGMGKLRRLMNDWSATMEENTWADNAINDETAMLSITRYINTAIRQREEAYRNAVAAIDNAREAATVEEGIQSHINNLIAQREQEYQQEIARIEEASQAVQQQRDAEADLAKMPKGWNELPTLSEQVRTALRNIAQTATQAASTIEYSFDHPVQALDRLAGSALKVIGKFAGNAAVGFLKRLASGAKNAAIQLAKLAGQAVTNGLKKVGQLAAGAAKSILHLNRGTRQSGKGFQFSLKNLLRYGLGIRSLFVLFNRLRSAIKEGFGELTKRGPRVRTSLASLKASLNGLKGSLATAFAPILTAAAPALTTLINMLTSAINAIGAFMAALTGQKTYQRAVSGLEATGGAASGAAGSVKKLNRELAGFDELNILGKTDSSGGGGGGGGGSGSAFSYETEEISSGITDFVQKLKDLWAAADYEGIGREIAGAINGAFEKARQLISWDALGDKITQAVDAITGIFNGLVDGINWDGIGRTFGTGINTILNTVNQLFTKINWANLGKKLAEGLNGLVDEVDWGLLGQTFANRINAVFSVLSGAVSSFNFEGAAVNLANAFNRIFTGIDWNGIARTASDGFNRVVNSIKTFVMTFRWGDAGTQFGNAVHELFSGINWTNLGETAASLIAGPLEALKNAIREFSFSDVAKNFADAVNGFFSNQQMWADAGTIVSESIKGLFTWGAEFLDGLDAEQIAADVRAFFKEIDWDGIAKAIWAFAISAMRKLGNLVLALIFGPDYKDKTKVQQEIEDYYSGLSVEPPEGRDYTVNFGLNLYADAEMDAFNQLSDAITNALETGNWVAPVGLDVPDESIEAARQEFIKEWKLINPEAPITPTLDSSYFRKAFEGIEKSAQSVADDVLTAAQTMAKGIKEYLQGSDLGAGEESLTKAPRSFWDEVRNLFVRRAYADEDSGAMEYARKYAKALEANTKATEESRKAFEEAGGDLKGWDALFNGKQTVNVGVNYTPEGQGGASYTNNPMGWLRKAFAPGADTQTRVELVKKIAGQTPATLFETSKVLDVFASLLKKNSKENPGWLFGTGLNVLASLLKKNSKENPGWLFGTGLSVLSSLFKKDNRESPSWLYGTALSVMSTLSQKNGTNGIAAVYGTVLSVSSTLAKKPGSKDTDELYKKNIEVTATIKKAKNNEISWTVTQSQVAGNKLVLMAKAMGGIITAAGRSLAFASGGMLRGGHASLWNGVQKYASGTSRAHGSLFVAGEAGPEIIGHVNGRTEILNQSQLAQTMRSAVASGMLAALSRVQIKMPTVATGSLVPYEVSAQIAKSAADIQGTLNANNEDLIQTIISVAGQLVAAVGRIQPGQTGQGGTTAQQVIDEINRRTLMFGASPLKGV